MGLDEIFKNPRGIVGDSGPRGHSFENIKKTTFGNGIEECMYRISGFRSFSFGQEVCHKQTSKHNIV